MSEHERLGKRERHDLILGEIRASAAIRVSELAERFGVSGETIRRDLAELGEAGLVSRTYGGATIRPMTSEPTISERGLSFVEERARIGHAAAARVERGQTVMIDGGSTTYQAARHLAQLTKDLVIITNSVSVASIADMNPTFHVILCPGRYDLREASVLGEDTLDYLSRFNANFAIIGASALSADGPCDAIPGSAAVKRTMLSRASEAILVIDQSKFARTALQTVCPFEALGEIITDGHPPDEIGAAIRNAGTKLSVV